MLISIFVHIILGNNYSTYNIIRIMSGEDFWQLNEGDYLRFIKPIVRENCTWSTKDLIKVEYREHGNGVDVIWLKNLSLEKDGVTRCVERFDAGIMLNYAYKVDKDSKLKYTTLQHKYKIGDNLWHMVDNKPKKETINGIIFVLSKTGIKVRYTIEGSSGYFEENKAYGTCNELLNSLRVENE